MNKYLITYDLCTPGKDYSSLIDAIKEYGFWAKICESSWAIKADSSCTSIRDNLKRFIDSNDRIFVCSITSWASFGLPKEVTDWLNN